MDTTNQQYSEDFALALSVVSVSPSWDERHRTDRPMQKVWLAETRTAKARLQAELDKVAERERILMTELLTDEDLANRAQLARDLQDDTLGDRLDDTPVTACPDWCETPGHDGQGKHHEGAIFTFHAEDHPGEKFLVSVVCSDDGAPMVDLEGGGSFSAAETGTLIEGLEAARQLAGRIAAGR